MKSFKKSCWQLSLVFPDEDPVQKCIMCEHAWCGSNSIWTCRSPYKMISGETRAPQCYPRLSHEKLYRVNLCPFFKNINQKTVYDEEE